MAYFTNMTDRFVLKGSMARLDPTIQVPLTTQKLSTRLAELLAL